MQESQGVIKRFSWKLTWNWRFAPPWEACSTGEVLCLWMRYDQPTTPAEMVGSHRVVAHGYYVGARENQASPGVTPEQTVGDNVGLWWTVEGTNDAIRASALNFWSVVGHHLGDEHLPSIERPFSRPPEVYLVGQSAWTGWLLKQHTPNLAEILRRKIAFLPWGSIACMYDVKHQFCGRLSCRLSPREVTRKGCHQWQSLEDEFVKRV